ncbi:MAG TPA: autoinducer binding domain-containing protein [Gallionella sp.]
MNTWQEDQLQALQSSKCEHSLFQSIVGLACCLDFDFCAYGIRMPLPISAPAVVMYNNYPSAWQTEYRQKNYLAIDPTVKHAERSQEPIVWSTQTFIDSPDLWDDAQAIGLRVGWAQPSRGANHAIGLLSLARSAEDLSITEIRNKQFKLAWLAQTCHIGMSKLLAPKYLPGVDLKLSSREIDVLRWSAEGKTASEVANILRISERTVNFHASNAISKLGVANKMAACIHAALLGIL